jgi:hypothetical protein
MKELKIINNITEILSEKSSEVLTHYTAYYTVQAISLIVLGIIILYAAFKLDTREWEAGLGILFKFIAYPIGLLFIFMNIDTLFSPEAMAIHQLIRDIKK